MNKSLLACVFVCLLIGCHSTPVQERDYPPQTGTIDPAGQEFVHRLHYPYKASRARRYRIEHALEKVYLGSTEAQVLAALGPPDMKRSFAGYPPKIPPFEEWEYFHTLKEPSGPNINGKMITFLIYKNEPRVVRLISPYDIPLPNRLPAIQQ